MWEQHWPLIGYVIASKNRGLRWEMWEKTWEMYVAPIPFIHLYNQKNQNSENNYPLEIIRQEMELKERSDV